MLGIKVGYSFYQIGRPDYLESFFSTIAFYLENKKWGSKYPCVMKELYGGEIDFNNSDKTIDELINIKNSFDKLDKENNPIIWNARNLNIETPEWAINSNSNVQTLKDYFVTTDGRNLIDIFLLALKESKEMKCNLFIKSLDSKATTYF